MTPLQRPTIVLFDMDGTTVRHVNPAFLGLLERIDDIIFKSTAWTYRAKPHPDFSIDSAHKPRLLVHRALHKFRRKSVEQIVQPCPGIYTVLTMFHDAHIEMGIVSNSLGKGYGHDILEKFDLARFFKARIFREDIQRSKPDPEPILRALEHIGRPILNHDIIWYIGDRHKDIIAALAADREIAARIIPFAYGLKAGIAILEKGLPPDRIIMNYTDFAGRIYPIIREDSHHTHDDEDDDD